MEEVQAAAAALAVAAADLERALRLLAEEVALERVVSDQALRRLAEEDLDPAHQPLAEGALDRVAVGLALDLVKLLRPVPVAAVVALERLLLDLEAGERRPPRLREERKVALEQSPLEEATTRAVLEEGLEAVIRPRRRLAHLDLVVVVAAAARLAARPPRQLSQAVALEVAAALAPLLAAVLKEGSNHLLAPLARLPEEEDLVVVVVVVVGLAAAAALALSQHRSSRISLLEPDLDNHRNSEPTSLRGRKENNKRIIPMMHCPFGTLWWTCCTSATAGGRAVCPCQRLRSSSPAVPAAAG